MLESGQSLIDKGYFHDAINCLEFAAAHVRKKSDWKSPQSFKIHFLLALASLEAGELNKSASTINAIEAAGLKLNNDCWMIRCSIYDRRHEYQSAGLCYLEAGKEGVDIAYGFAGSAFTRAGNISASAAAYRRAIDKNPQDSTVLLNYGAVLRRLRRYKEAESVYSRATAARPTHAGAHLGLGKVLFDKGSFNSSMVAFRTAWKLCTTTRGAKSPAACPPAHGCEAGLGLARSLQRQRRNDSSVRQYEAALSGPCGAVNSSADAGGRRLLAQVHGSLAGEPPPPGCCV